jgi:hypothetical protein
VEENVVAEEDNMACDQFFFLKKRSFAKMEKLGRGERIINFIFNEM